MTTEWIPTRLKLPEPNTRVDWIAPSGEQVNGGAYVGGAVWYPPGSNMFVYYKPEFWRPAAGVADAR